MHRPGSAAAVALLAFVLAIAGCASPSGDPAVSTASPPPTAVDVEPSNPSPSASAGSETEATPSTVAGAYVEYSDGAIQATPGPKALFFHASWCPQCRALDEDLKARGAPDGLTVFKVDYDGRTDLRQKYGVTLQTTVVFVDDAGELISSSVLYDEPSVASLVAAVP